MWALLTNSCQGRVGENSAPSWPRPCPVNGEPGALSRRPPGSTTKLSISEVPVRVPTRKFPEAVEEHVPYAGAIRDRDRRAWDRGQAAIKMQAEAGIAAAAVALVGDVDETGPGDRDADRRDTAGRHRLAD